MKKTLSIIALCLIAVLAGTIIVFSCINKDFNLNLNNPDFINIYINSSTKTGESYGPNDDAEHKEVYDKIMSLYNNSFKQKMMSALFNGTLTKKTKITKDYNSNISSTISSGIWLEFNYNSNPQKIKLNGKEYKDDSSYSKEYNRAFVEVKNSDTATEFNIYLIAENGTSYYHYIVLAAQSELYSYLNTNFAN